MQDTDFERNIEKVAQLADNLGYFERFYEILPEVGTNRAAWERIEEERASVGLPERYTSYESFKTGKYQQKHVLFRVNSDGDE